jgi:hypothetical protein
MGYLHINNLYKDQTILLFKEAYALEKIHGTSAHISWNPLTHVIHYFAGGESHEKFIALFDDNLLKQKFNEMFPDMGVVVFGEAYGGKQQGMSHTYGKELKFIGFDVKVGENWLNVPNANDVCNKLGLEFVYFVQIDVTLPNLMAERDKPSVQAVRNGCGDDKKREGIVLRPLVEMRLNNGERVICKYKPDEFNETKTKREVNPETLKILADAKEIAEEWVTNMRLEHVLQKFPADVNMESMGDVIKAMVEDVNREASGEIVGSKEANKAIGAKTVQLFKQKLQSRLK